MKEELSGVVIVDKCEGMTSHDVVNRLRRIFKTKKVGHTGTLDPMATGVLPVLVGNAVKASSFLVSDSKTYRAKMILGIETDTEDVSGKILKTTPVTVGDKEVDEAVLSFLGASRQIPPMYSALKVGGKKLCDLAREGIEIEREAREVFIDEIRVIKKLSSCEWEIFVSCSKGTYIRTLISDIGKKLGCGGAMSALRRERSGSFMIENSYTLEELEDLSEKGELEKTLIPTEELFSSLDKVQLSPFYSRLARNGQPIYSSRAKISLPDVATRVTLYDENGVFFALGEVVEYDGEKCAKSIKMFDFKSVD